MDNDLLIRDIAIAFNAFRNDKPYGSHWRCSHLKAADVLTALRKALPGLSPERTAHLQGLMAGADGFTLQTIANFADTELACGVILGIPPADPTQPMRKELLFANRFCHQHLAAGGTVEDFPTTLERENRIRAATGQPLLNDRGDESR